VNKGFEATAIGRLSDNLTTYSGVTLINSVLQNTGDPATEGKNYVGLPQLKSNILLEYAIPAVKGLVATGDWQYTAKRPADDTNLYYVPAYSLVDLGVRYSARLWSNATTWRLLVENVGNVHYYSTIGPSNITGSNSGNLTAHQGVPRTVSASMSMRF
jgi:iron complex outermembrane receptor protein